MTKDPTFKVLPFRLDPIMYRRLKKLSHLTEKPMGVIIREGIEKQLNEYKKILTNSDITI